MKIGSRPPWTTRLQIPLEPRWLPPGAITRAVTFFAEKLIERDFGLLGRDHLELDLKQFGDGFSTRQSDLQ
jgi:hypothetical protein